MKPAVRGIFGRIRRQSLPAETASARRSEGVVDTFHHSRSKSISDALIGRVEEHCDNRPLLMQSSNKCDEASFFTLPTELHVQILLALQYQDLCSFRATSTRARDLLNEGEVIRQWINQKADRQQLQLYPPPTDPTFQYLLAQESRQRRCIALATVLAEYIEREILRYTLRRLDVFPNRSRNEVFQTVKLQLRDKMVPLIITLQHYFEQTAAILLRTVRVSGDTFRPMYRAQEREVIESYDPDQLHLVHKFWMFIIWLSNQILQRPSYAGTFERTIRGWSMDPPLNRFTYRLFLILGNMDAMVPLINATTPKHRRKVIDSLLSGLDPERTVMWQQHWQALTATGEKQVTKEQAKKILSLELSDTEVWVESAEVVLIQKNVILPQSNVPIGTPWQVMDFLCDLAVYDVLHLPPSMQ